MSDSEKPDPWRVRKADGTEIRVPTRALLESWILAGVVEPEDKVARPGEDDYVLVRQLKDVSDAVETGAVVHGPRTVPTHPPVFAVVDGPKTVPPPVPTQATEVLELEPLEGDTIQDAPVVDEREPTEQLEVAHTRAAALEDDLTAPDYPSASPEDDRLPPEGATLDEMLPDLATGPQPGESAPRTGRVAVAPTTLAPLIVGGNYVSDQAVDPSERLGVNIPHIGADGEVLEGSQAAPRTGRVAVRATDIDAAQREMEIQSTHPERTGIADPHEHPTEPAVARVTKRPDVALQSPQGASKPSALHRTLNKTPSAPAAKDALSRPLQRAGAMGGAYSEDLEIRAMQRERRRTVAITVALLLIVGGAGAFWWSGAGSSEPAPDSVAASDLTKEQVPAAAAAETDQETAAEPTAVNRQESEPAADPNTPVAPIEKPATAQESAEAVAKAAELDEQKKAAETARLEASAAIDEEIESEAKAIDAKSASKKKAKKAKKQTESESGAKSYASLMRAAKKLRRKQPSKALALYKQALAQRPGSPDALINVGKLQMKSGKASAAINTFKKCRKARPRYTPCMYSHGRALEKAGRRSEARKAYENYLDVNPDGSQAADVRKRLSM